MNTFLWTRNDTILDWERQLMLMLMGCNVNLWLYQYNIVVYVMNIFYENDDSHYYMRIVQY
jgi:hypothetical protein